MAWHLYAKEAGIDDLIWIECFDTKPEAVRARRYYAENYPDDSMGWPCRYLIDERPPEADPIYEQTFSNTQVL